MKRNQELDAMLDQATAEIRGEIIDNQTVTDAADRVWAQLSMESANANAPALIDMKQAEHIENCADFQSLIPAYLRGSLNTSRSLLLEDHTHECIPCRKALKLARTGQTSVATVSQFKKKQPSVQPAVWKWAIAAMALISFGFASYIFVQRSNFFGHDVQARVRSANGVLYRVSETESRPLAINEEIHQGERIRTAKDATAVVELADGSQVEMRERSEVSMTENNQGATIHLERGNVIVEAAKQHQKHLYVQTADSLVSVTGTIFSVNSGTKGSRVSVVEGEVHVNHAGNENVLHPGDQVTSQPSLERVPVQQEVAWSRNADKYAKLVNELVALRKDLNQNVPKPGLRYSSRFLEMVPEGTVLYAALPNFTATLTESHRIMQERIDQNAALRDWWNEEHKQKGIGPNEMIGKIREFGEYLGEEIVISAEMDAEGHPNGPLVLGELKNSAAFRPYLENQLKAIKLMGKNGPTVQIIDDPLAVSDTQAANEKSLTEKAPEAIYIWINSDFFAASPKIGQLKQLASILKSPGSNQFAATAFHERIASVYKEGAGLIVAADLEKITAQLVNRNVKSEEDQKRVTAFRELGLLNLKYFVVDQKEVGNKTHSRAVLSFSERRGIASWLAAPGPMGALEFISPDANVVSAFVVKDPASLVDDLMGVMDKVSPDFRKQLEKTQAEHGFNLRQDIAAPLGGEFAFAIDGPIIPTPSWKIVLEVYDQPRLQQTFEKMVDEVNKEVAKNGGKGTLHWERAEVSGHTFYTLKSDGYGVEFNYTYANGYLIAAPSRALLDRAIRYRESGYTLLHSARFIAALPEDGNANFSAILYHDLAPLLQPVANKVSDSKSLTEEQQQALKSFADAPPTLAYVYAQGDSITFAANTEGGPFGLSLSNLLGAPNNFEIQGILMRGMHDKEEKK